MALNIDSLLEEKELEVEIAKGEELVDVEPEIKDDFFEKVEVIKANEQRISTESEDEQIDLVE